MTVADAVRLLHEAAVQVEAARRELERAETEHVRAKAALREAMREQR